MALVEPRQVLHGGRQHGTDQIGLREDRVALGEIDVAAILATRIELHGARRVDGAAMGHAVGDHTAGEHGNFSSGEARMIESDQRLRQLKHGPAI